MAAPALASAAGSRAPIAHIHPVNRSQIDQATLGQRTAEQMARVIGS